MTDTVDHVVEQQTDPTEQPTEQTTEQPTAPVPSEQPDTITFAQAGEVVARQAMKNLGLPAARVWFQQTAPDDEASLMASGKPAEFWNAMFNELASYAGTA